MIRVKLIAVVLIPALLLTGCAPGDPLTDDVYLTGVWGEHATFETIHLTGQSASDPAIKIDGGELALVPESGAIEYDGESFYLTNIARRRFISQSCCSIIEPITVSNSAVETVVFTDTLDADELKRTGSIR